MENLVGPENRDSRVSGCCYAPIADRPAPCLAQVRAQTVGSGLHFPAMAHPEPHRQPVDRFPTGFARVCAFAAWFFSTLFAWQIMTAVATFVNASDPGGAIWAGLLADLREAAWLLLGCIGAMRIGRS